MAQKGKVAKLRPKLRKKKLVPKPPWWQQPRWIGSIVGGIAVVALIVAGVVLGPALFSTGRETPQIMSFTLASDTVAEDECPVFNFEVGNCSAITITQDGEKIMDIEITVPGVPAASIQPRHGEAYALTETQPGVETHYSPGIFPVGFKGASNGKPSKSIGKFGETKEDGSAEIEVRSWDGQIVKAEVEYNIVPASERPSDQRPVITPPGCAKQDASSTAETTINYFRLKNQTMEPDESPVFEFSVDNTSLVKIEEWGECVFYIQATTPGAAGASHQPRQGEAYALTETQPGVDTPDHFGIFPVGYKGNSNGKPSKEISKFGDTSDEEPSATITVCSPSGHALTDVLPFPFIVCTGGCECLTAFEAEAQHYTTKCSDKQCGYDSTQPPIDGYPKKYCFRKCPEGCECLTQDEGGQSKCYTGTAWVPSSLCTPEACGVDKYGQEMHCCLRRCPEECDCLTLEEGSKRGCYTGTAWASSRVCTPEPCGVYVEEGVSIDKHCCPKPPVVECDVFSYGSGLYKVDWTSQYADSVTMSINAGTPNPLTSLNGGFNVSVTGTKCFTFTAKNKSGMTDTAECCCSGISSPPPPPVPWPQPQPTPTPAPEPEPPCEDDEFEPTF